MYTCTAGNLYCTVTPLVATGLEFNLLFIEIQLEFEVREMLNMTWKLYGFSYIELRTNLNEMPFSLSKFSIKELQVNKNSNLK